MRKRISDLLDACQDDSVELSGNTPLSSARIKEMTMNNIETREYKPNQSPERFKPVRLLLAAAVIAALSVSALAAGHFFKAG